MLMEAARWLRESGLKVQDHAAADRADTRVDAILDVAADGRSMQFAVQVRRRAPYPHEVDRLEPSLRDLARQKRRLVLGGRSGKLRPASARAPASAAPVSRRGSAEAQVPAAWFWQLRGDPG